MKIWFICKVKYAKEDDKGILKNVSENYLVDAVSFTEAEARIYDELGSIIRGDFQVTNISKSNIVDVFHYDDIDIWHKCKITYVVADEDSGKEKKVTQVMLVSAHDVKEAYDRIRESLNNMLVSFRIPEVIESNIVEIFPYVSDEDKEPEIPENFRRLESDEAAELKNETTDEEENTPVEEETE
ncbi:DUF4494 domain-containing protein [Roseivirga sp. BDSF3-8]|uniref:DUF4494 domain-containing protein n=1 Tax=Roseivirga sp. BDSF3-8 TaxID=3241598 RepID=UPI0035318564